MIWFAGCCVRSALYSARCEALRSISAQTDLRNCKSIVNEAKIKIMDFNGLCQFYVAREDDINASEPMGYFAVL